MPKVLQQDERAILRTEKLLATLKLDLTSNPAPEQGDEREILNTNELEESKLAFGKQIQSLFYVLPASGVDAQDQSLASRLLRYFPGLQAEIDQKIQAQPDIHIFNSQDSQVAELKAQLAAKDKDIVDLKQRVVPLIKSQKQTIADLKRQGRDYEGKIHALGSWERQNLDKFSLLEQQLNQAKAALTDKEAKIAQLEARLTEFLEPTSTPQPVSEPIAPEPEEQVIAIVEAPQPEPEPEPESKQPVSSENKIHIDPDTKKFRSFISNYQSSGLADKKRFKESEKQLIIDFYTFLRDLGKLDAGAKPITIQPGEKGWENEFAFAHAYVKDFLNLRQIQNP